MSHPNIDLSWLAGLMGQIDQNKTMSNPAMGADSPGDVDPYLNSPENMKKMGNKKPIMPEDAMSKYGTQQPFVGGNYANKLNSQYLLDKYQQDNQFASASHYKGVDEARQQQMAIAEEQRLLANAGRTAIQMVPVLADKLGIPASELYSQLGQDYTQAGRNQQYLYGNNLAQGALQGQSGALAGAQGNLNKLSQEQAVAPFTGKFAGEQARQNYADLQNPQLRQAGFNSKLAELDKPAIDNWKNSRISVMPGEVVKQFGYGNLPAEDAQGMTVYHAHEPYSISYGGKVYPTGKFRDVDTMTPGSISSPTTFAKPDVEAHVPNTPPSPMPLAPVPVSSSYMPSATKAANPMMPYQTISKGISYMNTPFSSGSSYKDVSGYDVTPDMMNTLNTIPQDNSGLRTLRLMQMLQQKYGLQPAQ